MLEHGIYFAKVSLYNLIRSLGGQWNDSKERPLVCLVKSMETEGLYWAIPMGNMAHRSKAARERIYFYMSQDQDDLRSCYYHVGKTDEESLFFISDAVPITDQYIDREYLGKHTAAGYVIQNKPLIAELERKLGRILAMEQSRNNYFRQDITDVR